MCAFLNSLFNNLITKKIEKQTSQCFTIFLVIKLLKYTYGAYPYSANLRKEIDTI